MNSFIWTFAAFTLGFFAYTMYWRIRTAITTRMNYGQPIKLNGEKIGSIISIRYNGSKRYVFVDYNGMLNAHERFWDADTATEALKKAYVNIIQKEAVQQSRSLSRTF